VTLFFLLSGFVLPLRWFKTKKDTCIYGGSFRRYFRLMVPLSVCLSLYYLVVMTGSTRPTEFRSVKTKHFGNLLFDSFVGTWFGDKSYTVVTWTMMPELWGSYFVYQLAFTASHYRKRFFVYLFPTIFALLADQLCPDNLRLGHVVSEPGKFFIGAMLADSEFMPNRFLDKFRNLSLCKAILRNFVLIYLILTLAALDLEDEAHCILATNDNCGYWKIASFGFNLNRFIANFLGAFCILILALTSAWTQKILKTTFLRLLGKISFILYLIHYLFIHWIMTATYFWLTVSFEWTHNSAWLFNFFVWTPFLFLFSWGLYKTVDEPSKDFCNDLDLAMRLPEKGKEEQSGWTLL
jgi:peptidoglycan/LPS O-acetylase OafA/YrhL